jgi:copper(I)-binding protein
MDFIDWATTSQEWIRRGLVGAVTAVGGTFENNGDDQDDFVNMESPLSGASVASVAAETHANDYMMMGGYSTTAAAAATPTAPFLSKTAEAELYLLATNFLLCKSLL